MEEKEKNVPDISKVRSLPLNCTNLGNVYINKMHIVHLIVYSIYSFYSQNRGHEASFRRLLCVSVFISVFSVSYLIILHLNNLSVMERRFKNKNKWKERKIRHSKWRRKRHNYYMAFPDFILLLGGISWRGLDSDLHSIMLIHSNAQFPHCTTQMLNSKLHRGSLENQIKP